MGVSPSLMIPTWQVDTDNRSHPYANPVVRAALKERLVQECYYDSVKECGEVNLSLKEAILSVVGTRNIDSYLETDTTEREQEEDTAMSKRRISIECIIGFMSRLRNPNIHNFFIVILSILALGSNVSVEFWSLLTMMGLAFSRSWTINLVREIGDEIAATKPEGSSANVGLAVTDNKAYFVKTSLVHAVEVEGVANAPRVVNGHFLYTVNNIQVPLQIPEIDILPGKHLLPLL
jgi:hypothetical protein